MKLMYCSTRVPTDVIVVAVASPTKVPSTSHQMENCAITANVHGCMYGGGSVCWLLLARALSDKSTQ